MFEPNVDVIGNESIISEGIVILFSTKEQRTTTPFTEEPTAGKGLLT